MQKLTTYIKSYQLINRKCNLLKHKILSKENYVSQNHWPELYFTKHIKSITSFNAVNENCICKLQFVPTSRKFRALWNLNLFFSYAGLHCVVIKGYSKSAGYQPGVKFEDNRFRNSWNAVYVAGAWRFVQCNWGARHLVNAKEVPKPGRAKSDSLR